MAACPRSRARYTILLAVVFTDMNMKNITTGPSPGSGFAIQPLPQDTKAPLVIGIASMFIAVTAVFVAVRIYIRGYLMRGWGRDDSMFAATAVSLFSSTDVVARN